MDRRVFCSFCMFFLLGFLVEETPCEHEENMQTPHRKAWEIAHLSTEGLGGTCPPEPTAPLCGNLTHDLLAVRPQCKQCKQLSHRVNHMTTLGMFKQSDFIKSIVKSGLKGILCLES